jgi:AdoMet-dependent rRNA methyltransferase SPB1
VCSGYRAPDEIDPKFLDPKFAFEEVEDENEKVKISSIKKLMEVKKNRSGYDSVTMHNECDLIEFIECSDPFKYL